MKMKSSKYLHFKNQGEPVQWNEITISVESIIYILWEIDSLKQIQKCEIYMKYGGYVLLFRSNAIDLWDVLGLSG